MIKRTDSTHLSIIDEAIERMRNGYAPPREIYQIQYRSKIDWKQFPSWARPVDPEVYDGCCHEG